MIRLDRIQEKRIINDGKAGLVNNLTLQIKAKTELDSKDFPDFKIIFSEKDSTNIDIGLYYFKTVDYEKIKDTDKRRNRYLAKLMHITKAVMGIDYSPTEEFNTMKEATDFCIDIINKNSINKLFSIFITFGTYNYPSKKGFLQVRFNMPFIKDMNDTLTFPLRANADDILDKKDLISLQKKNNLDDINNIITKQ